MDDLFEPSGNVINFTSVVINKKRRMLSVRNDTLGKASPPRSALTYLSCVNLDD